MKNILIISLIIFGLGCTTAKLVSGPHGEEEHLISCMDEFFCNEKAADLCEGSYKVLKSIDTVDSARTQELVKCENSTASDVLLK